MNHKQFKFDWLNIIFFSLLCLLTVTAIQSWIKFYIAQQDASADIQAYIQYNNLLTALQCILGIISLFLPYWIRQYLAIPKTLEVCYFLFIFASVYLGEFYDFYNLIPYWDVMLHAVSGIMLSYLGLLWGIQYLTKHALPLHQVAISLFASCTAITIGTLWEIYEFCFDGFLGLNMQKALLPDGTPLAGRYALQDTMSDLIIDVLFACLTVWIWHSKQKKCSSSTISDIMPDNEIISIDNET